MKTVSILLIALALIAAMVGCIDNNGSGESYTLTIASTRGGHVTAPGEGMFTYDEGTVVNLTAEVDEGYRFAKWTGDVDTVDNTSALGIMIVIHGKIYGRILSNFVI